MFINSTLKFISQVNIKDRVSKSSQNLSMHLCKENEMEKNRMD